MIDNQLAEIVGTILVASIFVGALWKKIPAGTDNQLAAIVGVILVVSTVAFVGQHVFKTWRQSERDDSWACAITYARMVQNDNIAAWNGQKFDFVKTERHRVANGCSPLSRFAEPLPPIVP